MEGRRNILNFREEKYFLYSREKKNDGLSRRQAYIKRSVWGRKQKIAWLRKEEKKNELFVKTEDLYIRRGKKTDLIWERG